MAEVKVKTTKLTKRSSDPSRPRKKLARTRLVVNNNSVDLKRLMARRRLVVRT